MPQTCRACKSAHRKEIDAALAAGESLRSIEKRFGISNAAIYRHKTHVAVSLSKAIERREEHLGVNSEREVSRIYRNTWEIEAEMKARGDHRGRIVAMHQALECAARLNEMLSRAVKVQAITEPPSIEVKVIDISAEPATPATPQSLTE
jgi:hypothetical protein